ncbi:uncharacterized protein LOC119833468 isoform X2 [Zerene cesonia]|uniref:uncharacterized protein LOC119833468 isoform X2 n=1 Tax=Zerene cesonia TaxID=33412 RepID=UPI0018E5674B|nr:uncharacterized protein LOC119833468 isoform X2 [Zerene cesonia]
MDNIVHFEWVEPEHDHYFLRAQDLENCVTERILRNTFHDPLISSSDSEEPNIINWDDVFRKKLNANKNHRIFVPGCKPVPKYPKLSSLTALEHTQCLKVLCIRNPHILPLKQLPRPGKMDYKVFEEIKKEYEAEQKEYQAWAKSLWATEHCIKAIRPKPQVEVVYEAQHKMRAHELQSYPKNYELAAQIPLEVRNDECEFVHKEDLISIDATDLPQIQYESIEDKIYIMKNNAVPEPCNKHPCKFILPREKSVSVLPLTEIERELAQYAQEHDAQYIASESALRCLLSLDQHWYITVRVCEVIGSDGDKSNVTVLGSEFSIKKEPIMRRTYKAFKHLLEDTLVPLAERGRIMNKLIRNSECDSTVNMNSLNAEENNMEASSDDEDDNLCIDIGEDLQTDSNIETENDVEKQQESQESTNNNTEKSANNNSTASLGFYECTCKGSMFELPAQRSYKKWQVRSNTSGETYDLIVHCAHKARSSTSEVVLEPIPEYQLELGASSLSQQKLASLALALHLRRNAALMNVRLDGVSGEIVTMEKLYQNEFTSKYGDMLPHIASTLHATLNQLQGLLPGHYVLQHEVSHGSNALLHGARGAGGSLRLGAAPAPLADESAALKTPPTLSTELLPIHKFRRILPCAFTPYQDQLPRKPVTRSKTPPQALKSAAGRAGKRGKRKRK